MSVSQDITRPKTVVSTEPEGSAPRSYRRDCERGIGRVTLLVFASLIISVLYCAYQIAPFYYYYYEIQNQADQILKLAGTSDEPEMRKRLMYQIKKAQLPIEPDELKIIREPNRVIVRLSYIEVFYLEWFGKELYTREFPFEIYSERELAS